MKKSSNEIKYEIGKWIYSRKEFSNLSGVQYSIVIDEIYHKINSNIDIDNLIIICESMNIEDLLKLATKS